MVCSSVKEGVECNFMNNKGCQFNGGTCHSIVEQCEGCDRLGDFSAGRYCRVFPDPSAKWRMGNCNMATHLKIVKKKSNGKVNPLKASKRGSH